MSHTNERTPDAFVRSVETALDNFANPAWLGAHSPLAAPYFLGHMLDHYEQSAALLQRGQALQAALRSAAAQVDDEQRKLLLTVYFERNSRLDGTGLALALHLSERTFYRSKAKAVAELAHALNQILQPTLRSIAPTYKALVGRAQIRIDCLKVLRAGRSLYLSGVSGTGKTTLGTALAKDWQDLAPFSSFEAKKQNISSAQLTFWFTVRPSLNDHIASLVFGLGHFLRNLGAAQTWRQLVADQGSIQTERILGLLRYDLQSLRQTPVLICIDEVDLLQAERQDHAQIIHLLEELSHDVSILLMGQRVIMDAHEYKSVIGFDEAELDELLVLHQLNHLPAAARQQLLDRTRGNLALLTLMVTLYEMSGEIDEGLQSLSKTPSVEGLLAHIWRRLSNSEQHLLMKIAIFRSPSPIDAWSDDPPTFQSLLQRELVQIDNHGGVQVTPYLRNLIYERIPTDLRPHYHLQASEVREARAEYLAAMHHAIVGRKPAFSVLLWFAHRVHEIEQGRGSAALTLLKTISSSDLDDERERNVLRVARAELYKLSGQMEEGEAELKAIPTARNSAFSAYVHQLHGDVLEAQGRLEQAIASYRESLESLTGVPQQQVVTLHTRIGFLQEFRFQNREQARREALIARIKAEGFHGSIEEMAGNYPAARERYQAAYNLAMQLGGDNLALLSNAYSQLGVLALREGKYQAAIPFIQQAIECDQKRGDLVRPLYDHLSLSYAHLHAANPSAAHQVAADGLAMAERISNSYLIAGLAAGVGEAFYALGQYEDAEYYALYSLQQEENFFRASALVISGLVCQERGQLTQAVQIIRDAINSAREIEDKFVEADAWHKLGIVYHKQANQESAREAFLASIELYTQLELAYAITEVESNLQSVNT